MLQRLNINRLLLAVVLTGLSLIIGMAGFTVIEHYGPVDAFYMTVTTMATVGFGEIHPFSEAGRLFVSFYILYNLVVVAYLVSVLSSFIFDGELRKIYKMIRTDQEIKRFSGHVIVCGFGRNGRRAYQELRASGARVVVIEANQELMKSITDGHTGEDYDGDGVPGGSIFTVFGDATTDLVLQAGRRGAGLGPHYGPAQRCRQRVCGPLGPGPQSASENHCPRLAQNLGKQAAFRPGPTRW